MPNVSVHEGILVVPASGPLILPTHIGQEFLQALFDASSDDDWHIAKLYPRLTLAERTRLETACRSTPTWSLAWAQSALEWAAVGSDTGVWDLSCMRTVYREPIDSWHIKDLFATESGHWYATSQKGEVLSSSELKHLYNETIPEHLQLFVDYEGIRIRRTLAAMESEFVERAIQIQTGEGLSIVYRRGPANIPLKQWMLRAGETFVGEIA